MKKTALFIMFFTLISKALGFIRDLVLSYNYGTSSISDAYLTAVMIPQTLFALLGAAIASGVIPIYTKIEFEDGVGAANKFINKLFGLNLIISIIIASLVLVFTEETVSIFASGFDNSTSEIAIRLTRVTILSVFASTFINVFQGFLHIKGRFNITAISSIPMNFIIIISIVLSVKFGFMFLAYGFILGMLMQLIIFIPYLIKEKYKFGVNFNIKDDYIKYFLVLTLPIFLGVAIEDLNKIIDKNIASLMVDGGISALNYASRLSKFVFQVIIMAISTAIFPMITKFVKANKMNEYKNTIVESINISIIIVLPASIGMVVFSKEIITLLYARGSFDNNSINLTYLPLIFYSIGILPSGIKQVLLRGFYALNDTKTPVYNSMFALLINVILNLCIYYFSDWNIWGLALTTTISVVITTILLYYNLNKKVQKFNTFSIGVVLFKILVLSIVVTTFSKLLYNLLLMLELTQNYSTLISIAVAFIIYITSLPILKIKEIDSILESIKKMIKLKIGGN